MLIRCMILELIILVPIIISSLIAFAVYIGQYGNYNSVLVQVSDHKITQVRTAFDDIVSMSYYGVLVVCDSQMNCGDLIMMKCSPCNNQTVMEYLEARYPVNSTVFCNQYEKRLDQFSIDPNPVWTVAVYFLMGSLLILGGGMLFWPVLCYGVLEPLVEKSLN